MRTRRPQRGFSLIEVMISFSLLGISALGLIGAMVLATNGTAISRRRTHMMQFAQTRLERMASRSRIKIPTAATSTPVNCSSMAATGNFDPNVNPQTGGWMIDVIDGSPPVGGGSQGNDLMAGPLLVEGDLSGVDGPSTLAKRSTFSSAWFSGTDLAGCGSAAVTNDPTVMCREVHIEPLDVTTGGVTTNMLRVWVRVVQGGVPWQTSNLIVHQDIAQ